MPTVHVAVIQMNSTSDSPLELASQVEARLAELPDEVSLVILPELWTVSRFDETLPGKAEFSPSILGRLSSWARGRFCAIHCGSLPWAENNRLTNRSAFVGEDGRTVARYDKAHLIPMMNEPSFFEPGDGAPPFLWRGALWGNAICYDIRFPEYIRSIVLAGAQILLIPAAWPESRIEHWRTLLRARAIENQVFTIACNRSGVSGGTVFGGHSMGIAPDGSLLAEAGSEDETLLLKIEPWEVERVRKAFPVLESRRRNLYSLVSSI
ncbi:MAG: nitrilase-related carbon-nitrogen hydrolase [Synergistales bacterium]